MPYKDMRFEYLLKALAAGWHIQRASCMCGGNYTWMRPRESGAQETAGCICHTDLSKDFKDTDTPERVVFTEDLSQNNNNNNNNNICKASGNIVSDNPMVEFLYLLMRDHLPVGKLEGIIRQIEKGRKDSTDPVLYSNGWLVQYAKYCINRLIPKSKQEHENGA